MSTEGVKFDVESGAFCLVDKFKYEVVVAIPGWLYIKKIRQAEGRSNGRKMKLALGGVFANVTPG